MHSIASLVGDRRALVVTIIALQLVVPVLVMFTGEPPRRFGWQMFAGPSPPVHVIVVDTDGEERRIGAQPYTARLRPEIEWATVLPSHLCEHVPDARRVTVEFRSSSETLECSGG